MRISVGEIVHVMKGKEEMQQYTSIEMLVAWLREGVLEQTILACSKHRGKQLLCHLLSFTFLI